MTVICIRIGESLEMKKNLIFILLVVLASSQSIGMPISINNYEFEDAIYRYFLGVSAPQDNESKAIKEAIENATFDAIIGVHGSEIEISQKSSASMVDANLSKISILKSESVHLQKFDKIDQKVAAFNNQFIARVLFRYSKSEIRKEQSRLKMAKETNHDGKLKTELNQVGTAESILQLGRLEFRTFAEGKEVTEADIEIDSMRFASTPLIIGNRFSIGEHKINIKHPLFEDYVGTFFVNGANNQRINIKLKGASGSILINSYPSRAQVYLDGNLIGESPISIESLSIKKSYNIKVVSGGYYEQSMENIVLHKNENLLLRPILQGKTVHKNSMAEGSVDTDSNVCSVEDLEDPLYRKDDCEDRD